MAVATVNVVRSAEGEGAPRTLDQLKSDGVIQYIEFHEGLKEKYQSFTEADLTRLRECGYDADFLDVEQGVGRYVRWLLERQ